jgi:hypothetical protein
MNPEARIKAYLEANRSTLQYRSDLAGVIEEIKLSVFYGNSPISDEEIRKVVAEWAMFNAAGLLLKPKTADPAAAGPPPPPPPTSSELIDTVKKAIKTVNDGVKIGPDKHNVVLTVTGLTANLKSGDKSVTAGVSWSGALKLDAQSGPLHFSGKLSKDQWELTLTFPQDTSIPDLSTIGTVFTRGEAAVRNIAVATWNLPDVSDTAKVGALIKPHVGAVQEAVEAASGIAKAPKKGPSFGFKFGSPEPGPGEQGIPRGVQGSVVFTWVF